MWNFKDESGVCLLEGQWDMSHMPRIMLHPGDIAVIVDMLHPYAVYVRSKQQPSARRGLLLVCIEELRSRLLALAKGEDEQALFLSPRELEIIDEAFGLFIVMLPSMVGKSQERDSTLAACQKLRAFLRSQLFSR